MQQYRAQVLPTVSIIEPAPSGSISIPDLYQELKNLDIDDENFETKRQNTALAKNNGTKSFFLPDRFLLNF